MTAAARDIIEHAQRDQSVCFFGGVMDALAPGDVAGGGQVW
jgi:hypothetical protein